MKLKDVSGKEQTPLFKGKLYCWVYLSLFGISQDRVKYKNKATTNSNEISAHIHILGQ